MIDSDKIRTYRLLRKAGMNLHAKLFSVIPKSVLIPTAEELGLWKKGILVAGEGDTDILSDRLIYDKKWEGQNCLGHFETTITDGALAEHERRSYEAMKTAYFSLFRVRNAVPGSHVVLSDRLAVLRAGLTPPDIELIDMGLSETAVPGLLIEIRVLNAGDFYLSSGVSFPFDPDQEATIVKYMREKPSGFGRRRLDQPDRYSLYFYRLHKQHGARIRHEPLPGL